MNGNDELPLWTRFKLKRKGFYVRYSSGFIMDHYLVVVVSESKKKKSPFDDEEDDDQTLKTSVLAFSLLDHSVQEADLEVGSFFYKHDGFLQYDGNKIIKYSGSSCPLSLACITVESFQRKILI